MENYKKLAEEGINTSLLSRDTRTSYADDVLYYYELNKSFPSTKYFGAVKLVEVNKMMERDFGVMPENVILNEHYDKKNEAFKLKNLLFIVDKNLLVSCYSCSLDETYSVTMLYSPTDTDEKLLNKMIKVVAENQVVQSDSEIGIVGQNQHGLYIRFFKVNVPLIDVQKYYNDDFAEIHNKVVDKLNSQYKGVVLFHGKPGTGKTTYIRHLSSLVKKRMIFVTQEMAIKVASPDFLTLLMDYPDSILIMEDAENIIKDRNSNQSSPVANILNISDGLLSDCLNLQVICTFNTDIRSIDKALLRKGRIITDYEFKALTVKKANALSSINGFNVEFKNDATLAEIFNSGDEDHSAPERKKVGFMIDELTPIPESSEGEVEVVGDGKGRLKVVVKPSKRGGLPRFKAPKNNHN